MLMKNGLLLILIGLSFQAISQVTVDIDFSKNSTPISPNIYGKNNSLSSDPSKPLAAADWQIIRESGIKFLRENGGNNITKYNWKKKLNSHPDWYNNVYSSDWDFAATSLKNNLPQVKGMWGFQLLGKAASSNAYNFNDWAYNQSAYWEGVTQNLAGNGQPNATGTKALVEGNTSLYLQDWPADSTVALLDHWFGTGGLGLNKSQVQYWNMDNEVEIWSGTHDDVMPTQLSAEEFMQKYFTVAKKARAKFPEIKLVGPVSPNEWQWYAWNNATVTVANVQYTWLEFFIKRIAEEQQATGIRLLDVFDIHFYPYSSTAEELVQMHRVFFDKTYDFPEANGVKTITGGWDPSQTKEYIMSRALNWMTKYMGPDHGVTLAVSETAIRNKTPEVIAIWYASHLGEFMKHPEMDIFTPWDWNIGMWETVHLFSRYNKPNFVNAVSSEELNVSAYPSINPAKDSVTVVLVNRSTTTTKPVTINLSGFDANEQEVNVLKLDNLPATETFVSHTRNALVNSKLKVISNTITLTLEPSSIYSLQFNKAVFPAGLNDELNDGVNALISPNPVSSEKSFNIQMLQVGSVSIEILNLEGKSLKFLNMKSVSAGEKIELSANGLTKGVYLVKTTLNEMTKMSKLVVE